MKRNKKFTQQEALAVAVQIICDRVSVGDLIACNPDYSHDVTVSVGDSLIIMDAFARSAGLRGKVGLALANVNMDGYLHLNEVANKARSIVQAAEARTGGRSHDRTVRR